MGDKFLPKLSQNLLEILDDPYVKYNISRSYGYFKLSFSLSAKNFVN